MKRKNLSKTKGLLWGVYGLLFLCFTITVFTSCEDNSLEWLADDSSYEARIEEALIAIDDTEYQRAIELLKELKKDYPGDTLVLQYLSNAYAGLTGLDTFNLLTVIDELNEGGETGDIDMVGTVLGDVTGRIGRADIDDKLNDLSNAIAELEQLEQMQPLTHDQKVQLGLLSLNQAALTIGQMISDDTGETEITLTENGIHDLYQKYPPFSADPADMRLDNLSEDMGNIADAVDSIGEITGATTEENDLSENFENFRQGIAGADNTVTDTDLENYINGL